VRDKLLACQMQRCFFTKHCTIKNSMAAISEHTHTRTHTHEMVHTAHGSYQLLSLI
jgi:hypothetical protein